MRRSSKLVLVAVFACGGDRTPASELRNAGGDTCVPAPDASYQRGAPLGTVERGTAPDLDGDGRPEHWVTAQGLCGGSGNCMYTIFDGATCHAIGIVGANGFAPRMVAGRIFIAVEQDMNAVREARYEWTGDAYVPVAVRLCLTHEDPTCRQCRPWQALSGARYPVDDGTRAGWPALSASLGPATACDPRE